MTATAHIAVQESVDGRGADWLETVTNAQDDKYLGQSAAR
jgi:hypothetical protein